MSQIPVQKFIQKILIPLNEHWGYIYGTWGVLWTAKLQKSWVAARKTNWEKTQKYGSQWIGRRVTDCSGLVRWACNQLGEQVAHHSHYLYTDYCKRKGKLINGLRADGTLPRPGTLVFLVNENDRKKHVGVYIGDDTVIEAKGTQYGVVTSELKRWQAWGELKCIDFGDKPEEIPADRSSNKAITINPGSWLNLREGPRRDFGVIARIPAGAEVDIKERTNDKWWKISYNNIVGYAMRQYLQEK